MSLQDHSGVDVLELAMQTRQYDVGMVLINYYALNYERGRVDQAP